MANEKVPTCSGEAVPEVQLSLSKTRCLRPAHGEPLTTPQGIADYVSQRYGCKPQEVVVAVHVDSNLRPINVQLVSLGGISTSPVDPRVVFGGAMASGARGFFIAHTHPSGEPQPSADDERLTRHLVEGAKYLGITLFDHVIVARGGRYFSFQDSGKMPR